MIETILLPADFSATATNAGMYALELGKQLGTKKIVVYHTYETIDITEPMQDYGQVIDTETGRQDSTEKLNEFVALLRSKTNGSIEIEAYHSYADLTVAVNEIARSTGAQLIVMGITGGGKLKETVVGSHSVTVAKHTNTPVIIVPTSAGYQNIGTVLLVSDLKEVQETTPVATIKSLLDSTKAKLFVLNVTAHPDEAAASNEKHKLDALLEGYNPDYHFVTNPDFNDAVDHFVSEKAVDLVIVVPKQHGIFESIFTVNHTKTLAFHSKVPLMAAHK
jgi:nucleotide-binding universal stress UspA family protein